MNLDFSPQEKDFRTEVASWLHDNVPRGKRPYEGPEAHGFDLAWQRKQFDAGWAGIAWPVEYGGRGLSTLQQLIWYEEYARLGMAMIDARFVGNEHAGPTLMA